MSDISVEIEFVANRTSAHGLYSSGQQSVGTTQFARVGTEGVAVCEIIHNHTKSSGHYMCRTVVTICTAQWSLYVPHSGHYMYRQFNFHNCTFCPHSVFMCFVWISEQTAIISLYNINLLVCITQTQSVYCAVRTEVIQVIPNL